MTIDEELTEVDAVVQAARDAGTEHVERFRCVQHFNPKALAHYQEFWNTTISTAESTLALCRRIGSAPSVPSHVVDESAQTVQVLIKGVLDSVRAGYLAMNVVEHLVAIAAGDVPSVVGANPPESEARSCSFCGGRGTASKLVAGPAGSICAGCTRLACGVLGIALKE